MSRRIALLIGNQTFLESSRLRQLRGPANDVTELARVLKDECLGKFEVHELIDKTSVEIESALEQLLTEAGHDGTLLVFYAGHGKLDRTGKLCLATAETSNLLRATSIPASHLKDAIASYYCRNVILLLDCCYSGAIGEALRGDVDSQLSLVAAARGLHILTASTGTEAAGETEIEIAGMVMGKFTRAIVEGIRTGRADRNQDGLVSFVDLQRHVEDVLRDQAPEHWISDARGDPIISFVKSLETLEQKRRRRLGDWFNEGGLDAIQYQELIGLVEGDGNPKLVKLVQTFVDGPVNAPKPLLAALEGASSTKLNSPPMSAAVLIASPPELQATNDQPNSISVTQPHTSVGNPSAPTVLQEPMPQAYSAIGANKDRRTQRAVVGSTLAIVVTGGLIFAIFGGPDGDLTKPEPAQAVDAIPITASATNEKPEVATVSKPTPIDCNDQDTDADGVNNCDDKCPSSISNEIGPDGCPTPDPPTSTAATAEPDEPAPPAPSPLAGYAFFGIRSDNGWSERHFRIVGRPNTAFPANGDTVVAIGHVNVREGVIEETEGGWVNRRAVGVIHPGQELVVNEVQTVFDGNYVWFQFTASK